MSDVDTIHAHPDGRGVFIQLWVLDLLDGDYGAALLLSQLLWWHQPGLNGRPRLSHVRDGHRWLLRADDEWEDDTRLKLKQVRRIKTVLAGRGLVECRRFKRDGAPVTAWRPIHEAIEVVAAPTRPDPELPREGQIQGTTPRGTNGTTPQGAVPTSFERGLLELDQDVARSAPDPFDAFWSVYPRKTAKGNARVAWPRALKKVGDPSAIIAGAERYRDDPNRADEFTCHAATWLNGERWADGPLPARRQNGRVANRDNVGQFSGASGRIDL